MSAAPRASVLLAGIILLAACDGEPDGSASPPTEATRTDASAPEAVGTFTLASSSCAYSGPGSIPAGEVSFILASSGAADFDLWRLDEGHSYRELVAHIDEERKRIEEGKPSLGHPAFATLVAEASTDAAGMGTMTGSLGSGTYGMACIRLDRESGGLWAAGPLGVSP